MDSFRIKAITEGDFDTIVLAAGGSRINEEDSADYVFNEAIIELKLIIEEGLEKLERQQKLAALFQNIQPNRPTVYIKPSQLDSTNLREFHRIIETPIKTACKKASDQLKKTAARLADKIAPVKVLVILNVGYTSLSPTEFKELCLKCVRNDTRNVDWLICGGIYLYSNDFDSYSLAKFEDFSINIGPSFPSLQKLLNAWGDFVGKMMMDVIKNPDLFEEEKPPITDVVFETKDVRYVKPALRITKSEFWPGGVKPRENTTGIQTCPTVARTFPSISKGDWVCWRDAMPNCTRLAKTYEDWLRFVPVETPEHAQPLKPPILIKVNFANFVQWVKKPRHQWEFSDITEFANDIFNKKAITILNNARDKTNIKIVPLAYVHLVVHEIGNDKANDYASIYRVSEIPGMEREEIILENAKIFFEYALAVAAAYAIQGELNDLVYTRNKKF